MRKDIMKQKKLFPILFVAVILFVVTSTEVIAPGPKCVYGAVYINGDDAEVGIEVKIVIDGEIFNTTTVKKNVYNYIIGIPPGYEGKTGYFYVTDNNIVPYDNKSVFISSNIGYIIDLHVTVNIPNDPPIITSEIPFNDATSVPVSTSILSVYIDDPEDDNFDWSIETSPNIGSNSGSGTDGTKTCLVSSLSHSEKYTWYVNVTDPSGSGIYNREVYTFTCEIVDILGDMNGDGMLNVGDVMYLAKYLVGDPAFGVLYADGDVNSDGIVNVGDVMYLAKYLVGDPVFSPLYPVY
jgi:hypothetical protein